jgi:hypothetical protein
LTPNINEVRVFSMENDGGLPHGSRLVAFTSLSTETRADLSLDVVWTEQKQSGIIDSILRNYYIPPVIFGAFSRIKSVARWLISAT